MMELNILIFDFFMHFSILLLDFRMDVSELVQGLGIELKDVSFKCLDNTLPTWIIVGILVTIDQDDRVVLIFLFFFKEFFVGVVESVAFSVQLLLLQEFINNFGVHNI